MSRPATCRGSDVTPPELPPVALPEPEGEEPSAAAVQVDIIVHIFAVSATLVGVCLTVIGLIRITSKIGALVTYTDDLLALDAFLFLCACGCSFSALRRRRSQRHLLLEFVAENVFFAALVLMVAICALIVYEIV